MPENEGSRPPKKGTTSKGFFFRFQPFDFRQMCEFLGESTGTGKVER